MGHTEKPEAATESEQRRSAARSDKARNSQTAQRLAVLKQHRAMLLEGLLSEPDPGYSDLFGDGVDYQRLFDGLSLDDFTIDCRNDDAFDLPKVFNFHCKRRDSFNFFLRIFENRESPDRLYLALVHAGFKAVNLKYEREEVFLLLRVNPELHTLPLRDGELRSHLSPLFRDRRVVLEGELLDGFLHLFERSERLRQRALAMEWQVDRQHKRLILQPTDSRDRDEVIGSFQLFLFSGPRKSGGDKLQAILAALFRGESVQVPRPVESEFMSALTEWDLLLKLCRGRNRRRDQATGVLIIEAPAQPQV